MTSKESIPTSLLNYQRNCYANVITHRRASRTFEWPYIAAHTVSEQAGGHPGHSNGPTLQHTQLVSEQAGGHSSGPALQHTQLVSEQAGGHSSGPAFADTHSNVNTIVLFGQVILP